MVIKKRLSRWFFVYTLLHAEPRLFLLDLLHDSGARSSVVGASWLLVRSEDFGEDENVRSAAEGIWEDSHGPILRKLLT